MNLRTNYLGLDLAHPLMPGASPMVDDLDMVRRLEDAGASAIVMHSLFEEQIYKEQVATSHAYDAMSHAFAEAMTFLADSEDFRLGPEEYLEQVSRVKQAVSVPVIGSVNGSTQGGWLRYAKMIEQAGADALEINVFDVESDFTVTASDVEDRTLGVVHAVRRDVSIPIAVKIAPYYTSLPNMASKLAEAGADALVTFNRGYQPDIDLDELEVVTSVLSRGSELALRLRWLGILRDRVKVQLAASGGVQTGLDAIKCLMCGADVVQVVSALLRHGPEELGAILRGMQEWFDEHEYESIDELRGSMSIDRCPDARAYERANYVRVLQTWG